LWADPKKESANYFPNLVILVQIFCEMRNNPAPE
jgi:hypothetical protein